MIYHFKIYTFYSQPPAHLPPKMYNSLLFASFCMMQWTGGCRGELQCPPCLPASLLPPPQLFIHIKTDRGTIFAPAVPGLAWRAGLGGYAAVMDLIKHAHRKNWAKINL